MTALVGLEIAGAECETKGLLVCFQGELRFRYQLIMHLPTFLKKKLEERENYIYVCPIALKF